MSISAVKAALVRAIPEPIAQRVLPWERAAFRAAGLAPRLPGTTRLLIGPVNSAGQGYAWARAAETLEGVTATDFMYRGADDAFRYPSDQAVDTVYFRTNTRWQRAQRRRVERNYTHVIIESGRTLFGNQDPVVEQIRSMQSHGVRVALLWHGSDIRLPSRHARHEIDSPFASGEYLEADRLEEISAGNHALMKLLDLPVFVSTPDLLPEVPNSVWLPVSIDPNVWRTDVEPLTEVAPPVVVHAPSNAGLKGTEQITPIMRRLHDEGLIEYREVRGANAADMPRIYGAADIVLDQFSLGIYGVAACEAMAAGRVVVSHVADGVRSSVHQLTGDDLPVIQSRAGDLEGVLRRVIADPDAARSVASEGPGFVRRNHDGTRSAEALRAFLNS